MLAFYGNAAFAAVYNIDTDRLKKTRRCNSPDGGLKT